MTDTLHVVWFEIERSDERPVGPRDSLSVRIVSAAMLDDGEEVEVEPAEWMTDVIAQRIADGGML